LYTGLIVVVHLYCGFSLASDGGTTECQILLNLFCQFFTGLRKDSVADYALIWMLFSVFVRGPDGMMLLFSSSYLFPDPTFGALVHRNSQNYWSLIKVI